MGIFKAITQRLFGHTDIDALELNQGAWYIDNVAVTASAAKLNTAGQAIPTTVTASNLGAIAGNGMSGGNGVAVNLMPTGLHGTVKAGTGVGVNVPFTGIATNDILCNVTSFTTATGLFDRTSEYVVGNGQLIKSAGTNETGNFLMIYYMDVP